jgi:hypothetical protein
MDAVADQIGIDEDGVPPVEGGPLFDLRTAVWLAGTAFDSYNDPTGGLKKVNPDPKLSPGVPQEDPKP